MLKIRLSLFIVAFLLLSACSPRTTIQTSPTATGAISATPTTTTAPTASAATQSTQPIETQPTASTPTQESTSSSSTLQVAVRALNGSIQTVDTTIPPDPSNPAAFTGFLPAGGAVNGSIYALDFSAQPSAFAVVAGKVKTLDFISNPDYGLAVAPLGSGGSAMLAWGTSPISPTNSISLNMAASDGSQLKSLISDPTNTNPPYQFVAEAWSADGMSLYYSKEPFGIGGYFPFAGASSLYKINLSDNNVTELIPFKTQSGQQICLDALSQDQRLVADHCTQNAITIRDLSTGNSTAIQPPADATGYTLAGSARFSPDQKRIAFALAKGDPNDEMGWVAVSDSLSGSSKLALTGHSGQNYNVIGWLNSQVLLVQSNIIQCNPDCTSELWIVNIDTGVAQKIADGEFVTLAGP